MAIQTDPTTDAPVRVPEPREPSPQTTGDGGDAGGDGSGTGVANAPVSIRDVLTALAIHLLDPALWLAVVATIITDQKGGLSWQVALPAIVYVALSYLVKAMGNGAQQLVLRSRGLINGGH